MMVNFFASLFCITGLASVTLANQQPWLNTSLHFEDRLQLFIAQLDTTRKIAMTSGDTEVTDSSSPMQVDANAELKVYSWTRTGQASIRALAISVAMTPWVFLAFAWATGRLVSVTR